MDNKYKYHLDTSSKKFICPKCGKKRFVRLMDDNNTYIGDDYGRCDRETSCGYFKYPNGVNIISNNYNNNPIKKETPIRFDSRVLSSQFARVDDNLFSFFAELTSPVKAINQWVLYNIGCYNDYVIFWQIDINGEIRGGKMIRYDKGGHRIKDDKPATWTHYQRVFNQYKTGIKLDQCLFGEHLLAKYPDAPVVLVESEKTALIMSAISHSGHIWLASGGSQMLKNSERTKCLEGREVLIIPDQGQYWNWKMVSQRLKCDISSACESFPSGNDILDWVIDNKELLTYENFRLQHNEFNENRSLPNGK